MSFGRTERKKGRALCSVIDGEYTREVLAPRASPHFPSVLANSQVLL